MKPHPEEAVATVRAAIVGERAAALLHAQLVQTEGDLSLIVCAAGPGAELAVARCPLTEAGMQRAVEWVRSYLAQLQARDMKTFLHAGEAASPASQLYRGAA